MLYIFIKRLPLLFFILLLPACRSTFNIQTETFDTNEFPATRSFKFFNPQNLPKSNFSFSEENKKIIFDEVAQEFKEMGYSSHQNAALLVKIQGGTIAERKTTERYPYSYGTPYYYRYPTYDNYYIDISNKKTTIIVDVLNADTNKILWQGVATGEMGKRPEEVEAKLKEAIQLIFDKFPGNNEGSDK